MALNDEKTPGASHEQQRSEEIGKIADEIFAIAERLKAHAEKNKQLTSDTEHLIKMAQNKEP